jgi:tRNA 2-thiouridine synthesizing protein A
MPEYDADVTVDARELMCPMPIMAATRAIRRMQPDEVLKVMATDRGALSDVPAWAESNGHVLLSTQEDAGTLLFWIRKATDEL